MSNELVDPAQTIPTATSKTPQAPILDRRLVWIMAIACGVSVANLYYSQPLLADMQHTFHVTASQIGFIATLGQLGYAAGLLFLVPLGDAYNRRTLIVLLLGLVTLALVGMALAPNLPLLGLASFAVGVTTVVPQVIIPFAASLSPVQERGRNVGTIMSGLLIGILLGRTASGIIGSATGWRSVFWIAAGLMVLLACALRLVLPAEHQRERLSYPGLFVSMGNLIRTQPALRESSMFGALAFGAFSAFWVTLAFYISTPPYHYGSAVAGLFSLVGVAGALAATFVGKLSDRVQPRKMIGVMLGIILLSFIVMWLTGQWLISLIIGVILLDLGTQGNQVSNQARIYSLPTGAPSRVNTAYMVTYFVGGSLGSAIGTYAWSIAGWNGVCASGIFLMIIALGIYTFNRKR